MTRRKRLPALILAALILCAAVYRLQLNWMTARADEQTATCWVLCKPNDPEDGGHYVNARIAPSTSCRAVGYLELGDSFLTDAGSHNGFIRAYGVGENGESWVYSGFVVTEEPEIVNKRFVCVAIRRVAIRRWIGGPYVAGTHWLTNGSNVYVYAIADGWACTDRGYIQAEYLEADPE